MFISKTFDPSAAQIGSFNIQLGIKGAIVIYNESNIGVKLAFAGNQTMYCPAWNAILYRFNALPSPLVQWSQQSTLLSQTTPPISQIVVVSYQSNESIPGTYPAPLVRQAYIGNSQTIAPPAPPG